MSKKHILKSALILTTAGFITKILGFIYRIYMANIIGAKGLGLYQLIMPIYALSWSICCSGFTTTISKLVAEEMGKGNIKNGKRIFKISVLMSFSISIILALGIFFFADLIALHMYNEDRIIIPLKVLSLSIPFMAIGSCIRGYFHGMQNAKVPAFSQVFEQVVRMMSIYIFIFIKTPDSFELACIYAILATVIAEILATVYVLIKYSKAQFKDSRNKTMSYLPAINLILAMAIPLTLNRVISSFLVTYENMLIPLKLQEYGLDKDGAIEIFGKITGMTIPIVYFPSAFLTALSISLVPAISIYASKKDYYNLNFTISKTVLFTSLIGSWASFIFILFAKDLSNIIYNEDISTYLMLFGFIAPFLYIQIAMHGILNGLGYQFFIFRNNLIASLITIGCIYFLTKPLGIMSYFLGTFLSTILVTFLDLGKVKEYISDYGEYMKTLFMPMLSAVLTGLIYNLIRGFLSPLFINDFISLFIGAGITSFLYFILIIFTGCISLKEIITVLKYILSFTPINLDEKKEG